jgi:hypothetical protein
MEAKHDRIWLLIFAAPVLCWIIGGLSGDSGLILLGFIWLAFPLIPAAIYGLLWALPKRAMPNLWPRIWQ